MKKKVVATPAGAASTTAAQPVKVKVVMKGAKSLPATSLAGISAQQAAQAQAEEKQNHHSHHAHAHGHAHHAAAGAGAPARSAAGAGGSIARIGLSGGSSGLGFVEASGGSYLPASLPKTANILQFVPTPALRNLGPQDLARLFEFYASSTPAGEAKEKLRRDDLAKLAADILERLRRMLGEEMRKQGLSASAIPAALERELDFIVPRGKSEEERRNNLLAILLSKAAAHGGKGSSSISKAVFMQVWGGLSQELFTVRQDGALGCVIC